MRWVWIERAYIMAATVDVMLTVTLHGQRVEGVLLQDSFIPSLYVLEHYGKPALIVVALVLVMLFVALAHWHTFWRGVTAALLFSALYGAWTWLRWVRW